MLGLRWLLWSACCALLAFAQFRGQYLLTEVPVEPYVPGSNLYFLQGSVVAGATSPSASVGAPGEVVFHGVRDVQSPYDLLAARVSQNGSFELLELRDCWGAWVMNEVWFVEQCCKAEAGSQLSKECFTDIFTQDRCCSRVAQGKALIEHRLEETKVQAARFLPPLELDEEKFAARKLKMRVGTHGGDCGIVSPMRAWPKSLLQAGGDTTLVAAYEVLLDAGVATRKVLQIGVNDGITHDPFYPVNMVEDITGLGLEADPEMVNRSRHNLPGRFQVEQAFVTPQNIWHWAGPLGAVDVLLVDIDSWDCAVTEAVLRHSRARQRKHPNMPLPALLYIELCTVVPPPFLFNRMCNLSAPSFSGKGSLHPATYSCSLSHAVTTFGDYGYDLLAYPAGNGVFVRRDLTPLFTAAWGRGIPKDEFDCYRQAHITVPTIPPDFLREWFFSANDPQDMLLTASKMLQNLTQLSRVDGFQHHYFSFGSTSLPGAWTTPR